MLLPVVRYKTKTLRKHTHPPFCLSTPATGIKGENKFTGGKINFLKKKQSELK